MAEEETPRTGRAQRRAATREALVEAGARLVRERGFAVSVDDVAAAAGFTKGAVYSNFAGRAELMVAIHDRVAPDLALEVDAALPSLAAAMEDIARRLVAALDNDPESLTHQVEWIAWTLRDEEFRRYAADVVPPRPEGESPYPWPLPVSADWFSIAGNAIGIGLAIHRLMFGAERVPDELFLWLHRRLAGE